MDPGVLMAIARSVMGCRHNRENGSRSAPSAKRRQEGSGLTRLENTVTDGARAPTDVLHDEFYENERRPVNVPLNF
jgi:hypothetical protein